MDEKMIIGEILKENGRRNRKFAAGVDAGGCLADSPGEMMTGGSPEAGDDEVRRRCREDFAYWAERCVRIKDKMSGRMVPFRLNAPQRRVAAVFERERQAGRPIRVIMLKARQWGGSTLVQMYMAWIQSCHRRNWHSLICAHVKDTAAGIRGMYTKLLANYPENLWDGDEKPQFRPYERAQNVREISGRGCRVTIGSSENQEAVRGADYSMAHLSETAFWPSTLTRTPGRFIRAVCGAIALIPYSLIVMESTANGVGNYFHSEWIRCKEGRGDKHAVFVPWYEIEMNRAAVADPAALAASLDDYETGLWNLGLDLEQKNIQLNYDDLVETSTQIIADPEQMKRVINNIIGNSVKYMDKEQGIIDIRILDEVDSIRVEIEDNGMGIAAKDLPNVFERFYRTDASRNSSKGGSGIGLSIVKKIIEDHGGYIWATSKEKEGTCMHFVIRKYQAPPEQ